MKNEIKYTLKLNLLTGYSPEDPGQQEHVACKGRRNQIHAWHYTQLHLLQGGTVLTSYLKLLPLWLMVFPGMMSRVLYPNEVACAVPEECKRICQSE